MDDASHAKVRVEDIPAGDETASEVPLVSTHALDVVAEINAKGNPVLARRCLGLLAEKYDTLRRGYWEFRMGRL
jgi:hypothetical protein